MKRIVLPGKGDSVTLTPTEDSVFTVLTNGNIVHLNIKANQPTRVEFLNSLQSGTRPELKAA